MAAPPSSGRASDDGSGRDLDQALSDLAQTPADSRAQREDATHQRQTTKRSRHDSELDRIRADAHRIETSALRDDVAAERDRAAELRDSASRRADRALIAAHPANAALRAAVSANAERRDQSANDRSRAAGDRQRAAEDRLTAAIAQRRARIEMQQALVDGQTGLYAQRVGFSVLRGEIDRCRADDDAFVLACITVERRHTEAEPDGHSPSDELIAAFVRAMRATLRTYDPIVRVGPERFLCGFSRTDPAGARAWVDELRAAVRGGDPPGTIGVGIALLAQGDTLASLIARAEAALRADPIDEAG